MLVAVDENGFSVMTGKMCNHRYCNCYKFWRKKSRRTHLFKWFCWLTANPDFWMNGQSNHFGFMAIRRSILYLNFTLIANYMFCHDDARWVVATIVVKTRVSEHKTRLVIQDHNQIIVLPQQTITHSSECATQLHFFSFLVWWISHHILF